MTKLISSAVRFELFNDELTVRLKGDLDQAIENMGKIHAAILEKTQGYRKTTFVIDDEPLYVYDSELKRSVKVDEQKENLMNEHDEFDLSRTDNETLSEIEEIVNQYYAAVTYAKSDIQKLLTAIAYNLIVEASKLGDIDEVDELDRALAYMTAAIDLSSDTLTFSDADKAYDEFDEAYGMNAYDALAVISSHWSKFSLASKVFTPEMNEFTQRDNSSDMDYNGEPLAGAHRYFGKNYLFSRGLTEDGEIEMHLNKHLSPDTVLLADNPLNMMWRMILHVANVESLMINSYMTTDLYMAVFNMIDFEHLSSLPFKLRNDGLAIKHTNELDFKESRYSGLKINHALAYAASAIKLIIDMNVGEFGLRDWSLLNYNIPKGSYLEVTDKLALHEEVKHCYEWATESVKEFNSDTFFTD